MKQTYNIHIWNIYGTYKWIDKGSQQARDRFNVKETQNEVSVHVHYCRLVIRGLSSQPCKISYL